MPVITFEYDDLKELGIDIDQDTLIDILPMTGSDIEDFDDKTIKVEFFPNRPDQLSVEGVARNLKGFLGIEKGMPKYNVKESGFKVFVDEEIENIRPYISFAVIKNVKFNEKKLKQVMDFQEDLHWVIGRDRKKVAIGIHNLDVIEGSFYYKAMGGDEIKFKPLDTNNEMDLNEILEKHNIEDILNRGFAYIEKNNKSIGYNDVNINDELKVVMSRGSLIVNVKGKE